MHKQTYRKLLDSCLPNTALLKLIKDLPQKENADETLTLLFPSDDDESDSDTDEDRYPAETPRVLSVREDLELP